MVARLPPTQRLVIKLAPPKAEGSEGSGGPELSGVKGRTVAEEGWDGPGTQKASSVDTVSQRHVPGPGLGELQALVSGDLQPEAVAAGLKTALLAADPAVLKKAMSTLQVAESYARKAAEDERDFAGTGFMKFQFPRLQVPLTAEETGQLIANLAKQGDGLAINIATMVEHLGMVVTEPADAIAKSALLDPLRSDASPHLAASQGVQAPRHARSFAEEWQKQVLPGADNIKHAIQDTAGAKSCPYARGNHAKGVSFDNVELKLDKQAPAWTKDLLGSVLKGGMIRVSGTMTDPNEPDQKPHMAGIRLVLPVKGALDGSATQRLDFTANVGDTTHAFTAAEHTAFTQAISVPKDGLLGTTPVRAAKYLAAGLRKGGAKEARQRIASIKNAVAVSKQSMAERFDQHTFYARHAFFMGGRYVQVSFRPTTKFPDPEQDQNNPNARIDAVRRTIAKTGMELEMYITEMPAGRPEMIEQEGWKGTEWVRLGTIKVPPQEDSSDSKASKWFEEVPHVAAGPDVVNQWQGLGRHRELVYKTSHATYLSDPEHRP